MTMTSRTALLSALALLALPLATAQHGPPPGYTDPAVYAQDYAANQTGQAAADPAGYTSGKATPEALGNETAHAAWLACWTAWYESGGQEAIDPVCSQFFTAPGTVDAPAPEASAEVTQVLNGTGADAFLANVTDAVNDTVADPTSAVQQVLRIVDAALGFVLGLVGFVLDLLGLGGKAMAGGVLGAVDGLAQTLGLTLIGLQSAGDGLGTLVGGLAAAGSAASDGAVAAATAFAGAFSAAATALVDGLVAAGRGLADGASSGASAVGDGVDAAGKAVGDAAASVTDGVSQAVAAVGHAVASLFGGSGPAPTGTDAGSAGDGLRTGTDADGIVDRVLGLL